MKYKDGIPSRTNNWVRPRRASMSQYFDNLIWDTFLRFIKFNVDTHKSECNAPCLKSPRLAH